MTIEVHAKIDDYRPRFVDGDVWEPVAELVRDRVRLAEPSSPEMALRLLTPAAALMIWASDEGIPLDPSVVFSDSAIERYCATALSGTPGSRATIRSRLRRLRDVNTPPKNPTIPSSGVRPPYTSEELADLWRLCGAQTPQRARRTRTLLCLCAGAGCSSTDLRHVDVTSIDDDPEGPTFLNIGGPRARRVPILAGFDVALLSLTDGVTGPLVGADPNSGNYVNRSLGSLAGGEDLPHLEVSRLRSTWIVALMNAWVPPAAIMQMAGIKTMRTLEKLLPYCDSYSQPPNEPVIDAVRNAWRPEWLGGAEWL